MSYLDALLKLTVRVFSSGSQVGTVGGGTTGLNFSAPLTATPNTTTSNVDVGMSASPTFTNLTASTLTYAPGVDVWGGAAQATYTDASPHTVATIAIPVGIVDFDVLVLANLGTANGVTNVNAPLGPTIYRKNLAGARGSSGGAVLANMSDTSMISKPFIPDSPTATPGCVAFVISGNNLLIQVSGFAVAEAWTAGHTYTAGDASSVVGQFVTANGNVYLCTGSGTASGSAPTGTGTGLGTGATFAYVAVGALVPVQWTLGAVRTISG